MTEPITVFLVDDHALFRSGVRAELERGVPEVRVVGEAGSVDEAVAAVRHLRPQVVLLDLKLPKVDGLEILQKCKTDPRTKHIPIVVLTSSREEQDLAKSYNYGVNSYVVKPVDFPQFSDAVRQLGLYWMLLNQVPAELAADSASS